MRALSLMAVPQLSRLVRASASRHRAVSEVICASAWACKVDSCSRREFSCDPPVAPFLLEQLLRLPVICGLFVFRLGFGQLRFGQLN